MPKSNKKIIYLDHASATPIDKIVLKNLQKLLKENYANPGAIHDQGVKVKKNLEEARYDIAGVLGAQSREIIFTSGATESNNLAILGAVEGKTKPHIITTNIEHASVLEVCHHLEKTKKAEVTYVEVEKNGIVDPKKIKNAIKKNTVLVSVMYANNEIGTIQPIMEIAREIRHFNKVNKKKILFHTDATQAVNYLPIKVEKLGVDLLSFNSAKIYGPKGVGALYVKRSTPIEKIMFGGEQEVGLRPGTENVPLISTFATALKITEKIKTKESERLTKLRDYFIKKLTPQKNNFLGPRKGVSQTLKNYSSATLIVNGDLKNRLPNNVNITVPGIPSDLLVIELSERGIMAASKSACKAGDGKASHVIAAIDKNIKETDGSIRFSLGRQTTKADIDYTLKSLSEILTKLKKWYD